MKNNILVIMAAGLGSRFGGIKQLTPVGPAGEIIMEYSVYDAIRAGFKKVIFIIRKDIEQDFREIIGDRVSKYIETEYVFQDLKALPEGYSLPDARTKPWGTAQAVLACKGKLDAPFTVINADDYYGRDSFRLMSEFLSGLHTGERGHYCMAGFVLGNTLSDFGAVTRGICKVDDKGELLEIEETSGIIKVGEDACRILQGQKQEIAADVPVSMNMWGFTPEIMEELQNRFVLFLEGKGKDNLKAEYLLPEVVEDLLREGKVRVTVLPTDEKWFGVTYQEDRKHVEEALAMLTRDNVYPECLFC